MMGPWGMIKKPDEMIIPQANSPQRDMSRGQAIILDMCEPNFRWPSKVQALVYRIFKYKEDREFKRINDPDWWKKEPVHHSSLLPPHDNIEAWCGTLFGNGRFGPVLNWRLDFENWKFDPNLHINDLSYITLMLETRNNLLNIKIFTGRSMYDCVDIHSHAFNWRMGGANIFDVKYVEESWFIGKFGERKINQTEIFIENEKSNEYQLKMDPGYKGLPYHTDSLSGPYHGILRSYAKDDEAKKKEREFKELQDKIANMASVAKDI